MTPGTNPTLNYGFDASSNLTELPTGATTTYDGAGELTSSSLAGATTNYTYNADGEQTGSSQSGATISSATWNGASQLTAYDDPAASMTAASYDGNGDRITATTGTSTQSFVWNTVPQVPQIIMDSVNAYIYSYGLAPAEQVNLSTGTITYLVTDSLGSVRGIVNSSGSLSGLTSYDAWGNAETVGGLSSSTPFGFAGGFTDPTGLIYLVNRYYSPFAGQFVSVDPAIATTVQPYQYASDNPVSQNDPIGLGKHSKLTRKCFWSWGTGHCVWPLNHAATEFTIITLRGVALGEEEAGEALSLLPDVIGIIIDAMGAGLDWLAEDMENHDAGWGVLLRVWFAVYIPVWFSVHTR